MENIIHAKKTPICATKKFIIGIIILIMQSSFAQNNSLYRTYGDYGRIYIPVTAGIISLCKQDHEGVGYLFLDELVTNTIIEIVKHTFNTERPDGGRLSFPSGHSGAAFAGAGYLHMRYGLTWAAPFYVGASLVAHSRVYAKRHRYIDIIGGAIIAIATSYFSVKPYKHISVGVVPTPTGGINLGMKYSV
jgi:membrane-associated phospholipid phosphatase